MVEITPIYGHSIDPAGFEPYYTETHDSIALRMSHIRRFDLAKAVA